MSSWSSARPSERCCRYGVVTVAILAVLVPTEVAQSSEEQEPPPKRAECEGSSAETHESLDGVTLGAALQGRVPGVNVVRVGGGTIGITVRGNNSLHQRPPLLYLDGIRISSYGSASGFFSVSLFEYVNPSDVSRIEILRGPAATIQYGNGAAAGVIRIVTKRGGGQDAESNRRAGCESRPAAPHSSREST